MSPLDIITSHLLEIVKVMQREGMPHITMSIDGRFDFSCRVRIDEKTDINEA